MVFVFLAFNVFFFSHFCISETYTLAIKVNVIGRTCDVYGGNGPGHPIEVSFGEINVSEFTNERYTKNIDYYFDCGSQSPSNSNFKLKFESSSAEFNTDLVRTSNVNLGLKIQADNKMLSPREYRNFTYNKKPLLTVSPVLNTAKKIDLGLFTSTGVLKIEYQ
ncbi:TPA: fimbrial protein [Providencia alcalifaciens]